MKKFFIYFACLITQLPVIAQNVGIGTTTPSEKFTVRADTKGISQENLDGTVKIGFYTDNASAFVQTHTNHPLRFSTYNGYTQLILMQNGNFGIGVQSPAYLLDVAGRIRLQTQTDGNSAGIWFNNPNNTSAIGFIGVADAATVGVFGNTAGWSLAVNTTTGNVGVKTLTPTNKLQIGSMGNTGFATNDFAIGNGTNAMAIIQTNTNTLIGSTTDIVLKPRNNGHGRVGINTNTPIATLDVADNVSITTSYAYLAYTGTGGCSNCVVFTSIYASDRILANEFDAYSDARIKNIISKSNTTKDLDIINALQITDYTMKDKVKYGDKMYKKVIAQQVEKVYPQVVTTHTDFVPNVYQVTSNIQKTPNGYLLTFAGKHNISSIAKKLRVLVSGEQGMEQLEIISIPADNKVEIKSTVLKTEKVFVYGEEVDDFRTVDYEGLATLNISATQELSKLVKQQQEAIENLNKKVTGLTGEITQLKKQETIVQR